LLLNRTHSFRKRIDKTKRVEGPNRYGRKGTSKCEQCRRRHSKCVYSNLEDRCEFCLARNIDVACIKLRGPKTAKLLALSRPPPTADEFVIKSEDVLLLQSIYVEERGAQSIRALIRQFALVYGESISSKLLREAVLAYAARQFPESRYLESSKFHESEARRLLIVKLHTPEMVGETDLFAAFILMCLHWVSKSKVALIHEPGVKKILEELWKAGREQSHILKVFGPFCYVSAMRVYYSSHPSEAMSSESSTFPHVKFQQRVTYHRHLLSFRAKTKAKYSATTLAVAGLFWDLQHIMLDLLLNTAVDFPKRASILKSLSLEYLNDPDFKQTIATMDCSQSTNSHNRTEEDEVKTYLQLQKLSIELLITVLSSPSRMEGFHSPEAQKIAQQQLLLWGSSHQLRNTGEAFELITWAFVLDLGLVGIVCSPERTPEGTIPVRMNCY